MKTPILGSSYVTRSKYVANDRMVNLFPEVVPQGGSEPAWLQRTPGLRTLVEIGKGPIRGQHTLNNKNYVVSGLELYEVDTSYNTTLLGTVTGTGPVSMDDNGSQIFIACDPDGFIYNVDTLAFTQITDPDFPGAKTVGYLDGFFVFNEPNSQRIWVTALLEGTSVDALSFASAEGDPDKIQSILIDHREVWVFGENSIEIWYNAGIAGFPLERIQGAFTETGCIAPYSAAKCDNTVFWLAGDERGKGVVYRANGYSGSRVSTHAVEQAIQSYGDISDAIAWVYQQDGHLFYVLNFPDQATSWVYDVATQEWHERAGFDEVTGDFVRHRAVNQTSWNNMTVVGDYFNGKLYELDLNTHSDDGKIQKWLRSWKALPTGENNYRRTLQYALYLQIETGVGLLSGQGSDPEVNLRWSDNGGKTWSNYHIRKIGKIGEHGVRAVWRRLGVSDKLRFRTFEISGTDPVSIAIIGAELDIIGARS